jgi:thioredoxin-like negative regulator of GroEL
MTPDQRLAAIRGHVAQRPDDPFARYSLAMALRATGEREAAVGEFRELVRRVASYVPAYLMMGQVLEELGQDPQALLVFEQGVTVARERGDGHAERELSGAAEALRARGKTS